MTDRELDILIAEKVMKDKNYKVIFHHPDETYISEWDYARFGGHEENFVTHAEAREFRDSKKSKKHPDWAQPYIVVTTAKNYSSCDAYAMLLVSKLTRDGCDVLVWTTSKSEEVLCIIHVGTKKYISRNQSIAEAVARATLKMLEKTNLSDF